MTVSESLLQIAELTKQNLQILKVLNDSFYTKSNHLSTVVGDTTYTIPSYIALENKVNHVQDAINNLIHAAKSGEAWFNLDGNSREIMVRGYQAAPSPVDLKPTGTFETETRQLFKDMLTPQPYLNFDMNDLPDDIHQVRVKKVIPYHSTMVNILKGSLGDNATVSMSWGDFQRALMSATEMFEPGKDYLEYDTVYDLPVRNCTRSGSYIIEEVLTDQITENFENVLSVRISDQTPLIRTEFDGLGETNLQNGDELTTFDGSAKLKVSNLNIAARTMTLTIMSGEYVNPISAGKDIKIQPGKTVFDSVSDYSILRLYKSPETARELHIPLEEDKLVYITIAPINTRLNTQSAWGNGLFVNADMLKLKDDDTPFRSYYDNNVSNIGDAMVELATISYPSITKYSQQDWNVLVGNSVENMSTKFIHYNVVQINKHLNDSDAVKNIRALYSQKKQYQTDLAEVQARIASLTESLAEISFDDMSGTRSTYTAQISELKDQQNNLITSINKIVDNIALAANNAEIPIEEGKFHIRGYFDIDEFVRVTMGAIKDSTYEDIYKNVLGMEVRYRYRNTDIPQANVAVIDNFLFTEWETYQPPYRERTMGYNKGHYTITAADKDRSNYTVNEPKFNQIDIPISQGENVEFQVRVIYGFGHPFVKVATGWSDTVVASFPPELVKDVQVTTIIEENNNDIETNRFETILRTKGVTAHVDDELMDQDVIYFHKPESISSGFYTAERRVIPLKDKLIDLDGKLTEVLDMIQGTTSEALDVTCIVDNTAISLQADVDNVIQLPAYNGIKETKDKEKVPTGTAFNIGGMVYVPASIMLRNNTQHIVNIFSMVPGARSIFILDMEDKKMRWTKDNFVEGSGTAAKGPCIVWAGAKSTAYKQRANQKITYRRTNPYNGDKLDSAEQTLGGWNNKHNNRGLRSDTPGTMLEVWPICTSEYGMCLESDAVSSKLILKPGESVSFALQVEYKLSTDADQKTFRIGFDVRNSLYLDPLYYQITFVAKYNQTVTDLLSSAKISAANTTKYNVTVR